MTAMAFTEKEKQELMTKADTLKSAIIKHLWSEETGILRMSDTSSPTGLCTHINAYGLSLGVKSAHQNDKENLVQPNSQLPLAFRGLEPRFDSAGLCSPYSAAFAVEACFKQNDGTGAISLLDRIWGPMVDETHPNFSGGLWEAMTKDGEPMHKDTSLMHAWSSSPVYLLPMYLAGVKPLKPGWKEWEAAPVYAGLEEVEATVDTPAGLLHIRWIFRTDGEDRGFVSVDVPKGTSGIIFPPKGWLIGSGDWTCGYSSNGISVEPGSTRLLLKRDC
jgi:alpha-L-rhamnosidase